MLTRRSDVGRKKRLRNGMFAGRPDAHSKWICGPAVWQGEHKHENTLFGRPSGKSFAVITV